MRSFMFKKSLLAVQQSNSFGDQIILVFDLRQKATAAQRKAHPYLAGRIVYSETNVEGGWSPFNERYLGKMMAATPKKVRP